jgi:lipopolysaccharide/colanic/teichoic acid biosynthesis glycosyltransferase
MMSKETQLFLKRLFDIIFSLTLIILLAPLILFIALLIWVTMGRPILFRQRRVGYKGQVFTIYKFRTMTEERDEHGNLLPDEQRLTRFGRFLRETSLDELPELFNVLKGDMSLVGPRPLLVEYLPYYTPEERKRHNMRPGITGWAQVNGRNAITWDQKLALDVWYVDNWSLWLDFKIILMTIIKVIKREGISTNGYATAPRLDEVRGKSIR